MAKTDTEIKISIENAIKAFSSGNLTENSLNLFQVLGYNTERQQPLDDKTFACFKEYYIDSDSRFNEEKALAKEWQQIDLLFQLTKEEVTGQNSLFDTTQVDRTIMEAYLFFCIELNDREYTRTALSQITREINKVFKMPVMVLFKLGDKLSLAVINRRLHKKDAEKDVLEKVTLIKDINIPKPHRAHIEILFDLNIEELRQVHKFTNFVELHEAWKKTLDTKELNKRFYKELSNWYFWAIKEVYFPGEPFQANAATDPQVREHNAKNLIRLLTRLLFVWFVKEKNLVPDQLFDKRFIKDSLLNGFDPAKTSTFDDHAKASRYYRAVLQNLFFASLNQVVGKREFRKQGQHMNVTNLMRYESYFKDPQAFVALIDNVVPFMNGGLFECLDKPDPQKKGKQGGDVIIYEDGFSDRADNTLCVPDYIFFSNSEHADLSSELDDKKQSNVTVRGLINILNDYKFTVTENTPIEEDIALDPELLGRVFENLLASYNPETKTTARKQTGSFYTPREIVDYMVDESLKAYLKQKLVAVSGMKEEDADVGLNILFSYTEKEHAFNHGEKQVLIEAIDTCKVLDPACGSGAFPMGILHKLVFILHKLDPDNELWRERQRQNAIKETEDAFRIGNQEERENRLKDISDVFENNAGDFGRKLYLIENCIYGVDIQPIATQISKLRFFISLIVEQHSNADKAHNYGVIPLPNLETKFVAANTLIGIDKPKNGDFTGGLFDDSRIDVLQKDLQSVRHKLFSAKTPSKKRELRNEDKRLREQMGDLLIMNGWGNDTAHQMAAWDPYDQNASSLFFDIEWMFGIEDGFDVVIGNPPYRSIQKYDKDQKNAWSKKGYQVYANSGNIYFLFYEKGMCFTRKGGVVNYITSNQWMRNISGEPLRSFFLKYSPQILIDFRGTNIFDSVAVLSSIFLIQNHPHCMAFIACDVSMIQEGYVNLQQVVKDNAILLKHISKDPWLIFEKRKYLLREEIIAKGMPINKWKLDISRGILTGLNDAFYLNEKEKDALISEDPANARIIKPMLRGKDLARYYPKSVEYWLIHTTNGKYVGKGFERMGRVKVEQDYPSVFRHLKKYQSDLEKRQDKGDHWTNLRSCDYDEAFYTPKMIFMNMTKDLIFSFDPKGEFLTNQKCFIVTGNNLRYLTAFFNSRFFSYFFKDNFPELLGDVREVSKVYFEKIPVLQPAQKDIDIIEILVDLLVFIKRNEISNFSFLENIIEGIILELYFREHMKELEIDVLDYVSLDMDKVLKGCQLENLSDVEKGKVIEQLQATWSHPDNKVRNRIKLFAVRSPEILKPILES